VFGVTRADVEKVKIFHELPGFESLTTSEFLLIAGYLDDIGNFYGLATFVFPLCLLEC
jgi:hypothetical protein